MENTELNQPQGEDLSNWSFADPSEVIASQQAEPQPEPQPEAQAEPQEVEEPAPVEEVQEQAVEQLQDQQDPEAYEQEISDEDLEASVLGYLSERLGMSIDNFDQLNTQQEAQLDERVEAIARFVSETGRNPQDWFVYQSLNASEMDDMTAITVDMNSQYPNLSQEEIQTLVSSKYKLDSNLHTEEEIKLSQLQLKMDAESARRSISELRDGYAAPQLSESQETESFVTEEWVNDMANELDDLESVEFDLGNGQVFNFGLEDAYKGQLAERNSRLEDFFDPYVRQDGEWDHDKFNMHMAVLDNIESIVASVYKQGMSDGQRGLVDQAANVNTQSPNQGNVQPTEDALASQLREALGGASRLSFNI